LVDRALAGDDLAVCGDVVTGTDPDRVADAEVGGGDFFLAALREAAGLGGGQLDEGLDRCTGAGGGAGLDEFPEQHEERDNAGGLEVASGRRGEDAKRDELIDGEPAQTEVLEGDDEDGPPKDDGSQECGKFGDGRSLREEPVDRERVHDADGSEEGLPELDVGVGVIEPAVVMATVAVIRVLFRILVEAEQ